MGSVAHIVDDIARMPQTILIVDNIGIALLIIHVIVILGGSSVTIIIKHARDFTGAVVVGDVIDPIRTIGYVCNFDPGGSIRIDPTRGGRRGSDNAIIPQNI